MSQHNKKLLLQLLLLLLFLGSTSLLHPQAVRPQQLCQCA
jgi:hypothetical protein